MNKYTAIGLLAAAAEGKRIIVLSPHGRALRQAFNEVRNVAPDLEWRTANGDERVLLPSRGSIRFFTRVSPGRLCGLSADVVLVEDDIDICDDQFYHELRAVIAASPDGEIVRY